MGETQGNKIDEGIPVFGCFVISLLLVGLVLFGFLIYRGIVEYRKGPPPVIALSAYFVEGPPPSQSPAPGPATSHLKIKGEVRQPGKTEVEGSVLVTVTRADLRFEQAVAVELKKNGQFETEDASLAPLRPEDQIHIKADYRTSNSSEPYSQDLYLNTNRPSALATFTAWAFGGLILLAIGFFFYAFTGAKTNRKNQIAIFFSYGTIIIFLAVPLLAPVLLLSAFPDARRNMVGAPAGLIVTCVGDPKDCTNQWALNIGGYSTVMPSPTPTPLPTSTPANSPASSTVPETRSPGSTPAPGTAGAQAQPTSSPQSATGSASPRPAPTSGTPAPAATASSSPSPEKLVSTRVESSKDGNTGNEVLKVEGGLVIPLYVIVLSVIGGAINMTRKVPRLQGEGEKSQMRLPSFKSFWSRINPLAKLSELIERKKAEKSAAKEAAAKKTETTDHGDPAKPKTSPAEREAAAEQSEDEAVEAEANDIETKLAPLVESYFERDKDLRESEKNIKRLVERMHEIFDKRTDKKPVLGFDSFDEWMSSHAVLKEMYTSPWRVELLSQYMYLISAPFLAIVAYFMMGLLGFTKLPILVLISFSVGLISEKILNWLLSLASTYLKTDAADGVKPK